MGAPVENFKSGIRRPGIEPGTRERLTGRPADRPSCRVKDVVAELNSLRENDDGEGRGKGNGERETGKGKRVKGQGSFGTPACCFLGPLVAKRRWRLGPDRLDCQRKATLRSQ